MIATLDSRTGRMGFEKLPEPTVPPTKKKYVKCPACGSKYAVHKQECPTTTLSPIYQPFYCGDCPCRFAVMKEDVEILQLEE